MLMFLKNDEMETLNDGVKKPGPKWTVQCIKKGESSIIDFIVVEKGSSKAVSYTHLTLPTNREV